MKFVKIPELEYWANTLSSRTQLPGLVGDLIRASASDITEFRFPADDAGQMRGFDGRLTARAAPPYVPEGDSVWEFGTGGDYVRKANDDYASRTADPKGIDPSGTTFVFLTPRQWSRENPTLDQWKQEKTARGEWKSVWALDGIALEDWLNLNPAVADQFAREVLGSLPANGARCTSTYWTEYAARFSPTLTEQVLLAGREDQATELVRNLTAERGRFRFKADSPEEVVAFAVAAIRAASPIVSSYLQARTMVLDGEDAARSLRGRKNMVFLPRAGARVLDGVLGQDNPTIVSLGRDDSNTGDAITLNRPNSGDLGRALETMGIKPDKALQLARGCGRSVTVLARIIPSGSAAKPEWDGRTELIPALLAGAWNRNSEHDRQTIASLAGVKEYSEFEDSLLPFLRMQDPPIEREGEIWTIRAPVDAFVRLASLVGDMQVERFAATVELVFSERDPALDLPLDERPYANLRGKVLKHSSWLRDGLATTLLLVSAFDEQEGLNWKGDSIGFVNSLLERLPGLASDYRAIASLEDQLPMLMEATPRPLLNALGLLLEGDGEAIRSVFQDTENGVFGQSSPHTGLLWALEVLAWNPSYLAEAVGILAKLARVDPGGTLANRPLRSLAEVFLPWHPSTNAGLEQRLAVLDEIIAREPTVAWNLLMELLPGARTTASGTMKPRYREAGASERELVTHGLVFRTNDEIVRRALQLIGCAAERWTAVLRRLHSFSPDQRARTIGLLRDSGASSDALRGSRIWRELRSLVARHRVHPRADWAMPAEDLEHLEQIALQLEPTDAVEKAAWLFDDYVPDTFFGIEDRPWDAADSARKEAVHEILSSGGAKAILRLVERTAYPGLVAAAVCPYLDSVASAFELMDETFGRGGPSEAFAVALSGCAEQRFAAAWHRLLSEAILKGRWAPADSIKLIQDWRNQRTTWEFVVALGADLEGAYWAAKAVWPVDGAATDLQFVAEKFASVGRPSAAIRAVHQRADLLPPELLMGLLDQLVHELGNAPHDATAHLSYEIEQVFRSLRKRPEVPRADIAKREYALLPLFSYTESNLTLHSLLAEDPQLLVQILSDVFKPESGEEREPTPEAIARAQTGFRLLSEFHVVPGFVDGQIMSEVLWAWVSEVRRLAAEQDRASMADEYIGHVLAHVPSGSDGAWPHEAAADLVEQLQSEKVERGLLLERVNMRGTTVRGPFEGGAQERVLAKETRDWAQARTAWPRTLNMLERLAHMWERDADREDIEARQDMIRFS